MSAVLTWAADLLVIAGVAVMTLGVLGFARMPDVYNQLHAAGKTVVLGLVTLLIATAVSIDLSGAARAVLTAAFLVVTAPVSAHAVARGAVLAREPMESGEVPGRDPAGGSSEEETADANADGR